MRLRKARQPERFAADDLFQEASTILGSDRRAHMRAGVPTRGRPGRTVVGRESDPNLRPRDSWPYATALTRMYADHLDSPRRSRRPLALMMKVKGRDGNIKLR